jgi:predicted RNase H-like HicB family nuclease
VKSTEIIFEVREADEGGCWANALGHKIVTEGDTWDELRANIREAVDCHFDKEDKPAVIRLHFVRDEVIAS